jgi:ABC-type Fe3+-hydroxamate transport system substrate-binding protein
MLEALEIDFQKVPDLSFAAQADALTANDVVIAPLPASLPIPPGVRWVSWSPMGVEAILDCCLNLGHELGKAHQALQIAVSVRERLFAAQERVNPFADGPSLVVIEEAEPLAVAGGHIAQLVERAGASHPLNSTAILAKDAGAAAGPQQGERTAGPSRVVQSSDVTRLDPAGIIVLGEAVQRRLETYTWWGRLDAVRRGRVLTLESQSFAPGPMIADAFESLVQWVQELA